MNPKVCRNLILIVLLFSYSCSENINEPELQLNQIQFTNSPIEGETNQNGELEVITKIDNEEITYLLKVKDESGKPVSEMNIVYDQHNGKSIIYSKDHYKRYSSLLLVGTPSELQGKFSENSNGRVSNTNQTTVIGTIALTITVFALSSQVIKLAKSSYKISEFYLTDIVEEGKDYLVLCKDFTQVADLIQNRARIALGGASIGTSIFINFISGGSKTLVEVSGDILYGKFESLREELLIDAIESWGISSDELIGKPVAVKVFFPDRIDRLTDKLRYMYAYIEIEYNSTKCNNFITGVPDGVNGFLNSSLVDLFINKGLPIHKGYEPPTIVGNYFANSLTNLENGDTYIDYSYQFLNQKSDNTIETKFASEIENATGYGSFISGIDSKFSVYTEIDDYITDDNHQVYIKIANIYSGQLTSIGISNFYSGFIILQKSNDINDRFMNVGDARVIYESDNLAAKVNSFPNGRIIYSDKSNIKNLLRKVN
jgi:hypothetical protein